MTRRSSGRVSAWGRHKKCDGRTILCSEIQKGREETRIFNFENSDCKTKGRILKSQVPFTTFFTTRQYVGEFDTKLVSIFKSPVCLVCNRKVSRPLLSRYEDTRGVQVVTYDVSENSFY